MARIALLPTGRMEWWGLAHALQRLFPNHEFAPVPTPEEITTALNGEFPLPGFTDNRVTLDRPSGNARKLLERAAQEVLTGGRREAADLAIILDDLELANLDQASVVMATMHKAASTYLDEFTTHRVRDKVTSALRERVSFHLVKPMIEGWIFADCLGPQRAGAGHPGVVEPGDPEEFETNDSDYLADQGCTCYQARLATGVKVPKDKTPLWLRKNNAPNRQLHPKAYLAWLCPDPTESTCTRYSETHEGVQALKHLDWGALLSNPHHAPFARALIHDIADALGEIPPFPGRCAPETSTTSTVLRNL